MRQVLFEIPGTGIKIFGYGVMLFLAFLGSMNLAAWRARRQKLNPEIVYDLALWIFVGGLVGARLFYIAQYHDQIKSFWDIFKIWQGGIVLYGSIMGGTAAFLLYRAIRAFPLLPMLDVIAPALALGIALGRIGCFLNGCCYGDTCDLPWAVTFPAHSPAWDRQVHASLIPAWSPHSLPVHPTQLYSALDGFILLALLWTYFPLRRRDGEVMALLMMTYPITRFLIEHLRNDEGVFLGGMTISQNLSILVFLAGLTFWIYLSRLPAKLFADSPSNP